LIGQKPLGTFRLALPRCSLVTSRCIFFRRSFLVQPEKACEDFIFGEFFGPPVIYPAVGFRNCFI